MFQEEVQHCLLCPCSMQLPVDAHGHVHTIVQGEGGEQGHDASLVLSRPAQGVGSGAVTIGAGGGVIGFF